MSEMNLPGRLGNPELSFEDDPCADPRLAGVVAMMALAEGVKPLASDASYEQCLEYCVALEREGEMSHPLLLEMMPDFDEVESTVETIDGVDGNEITLFIERPNNQTGVLPGGFHFAVNLALPNQCELNSEGFRGGWHACKHRSIRF